MKKSGKVLRSSILRLSKKSFVIIFMVNFTAALFAFGNSLFDFSARAGLGLLNGNIYEKVFYENYPTPDNILSKLDWEVSSVPYVQAGISANIIKYIWCDLSGKFAFLGQSGNMYDYDWMNPYYYATYGVYDDFRKNTHYSVSENNLSDYKNFSASIGANIKFLGATLTPFINYEYEKYFFEAIGGDCIYEIIQQNSSTKEYYKTTYAGSFSGNVVSYEQSYNALFLGLNFNAKIWRLRLNGFAKFSPNLTFIDSYDWHWINRDADEDGNAGGTLYWDDLNNAFQFRTEVSIYYDFSKNHSLGLNLGLQKISEVKGSYSNKYLDSDGNIISSEWTTLGANSGTERFVFNFGLNYNFRF